MKVQSPSLSRVIEENRQCDGPRVVSFFASKRWLAREPLVLDGPYTESKECDVHAAFARRPPPTE